MGFTIQNKLTGQKAGNYFKRDEAEHGLITFLSDLERFGDILYRISPNKNIRFNDFEIVETNDNFEPEFEIINLGERDEVALQAFDDEDNSLSNMIAVSTGKKEHLWEVKRGLESWGVFPSKEAAQHFVDNFDEEGE